MSYATKRYWFYAFVTVITFVMPFITVNQNHLLLLSFEKLQFHFMGLAYDVNEFYIMPFLLMFFFIGIFALTSIMGRAWCGWGCPQTIFRTLYRDLIQGSLLDLRTIANKQKRMNTSPLENKLKIVVGFLLWTLIAITASTNFIWYFVPPEDFFVYMQHPQEHLFIVTFILSSAAFLVYDIVWMQESFCTYLCPYSRIQTVLYDDDTKHVLYNTHRGGVIYTDNQKQITDAKQWINSEECTTCEACVKVCPTHIDIRKGLQLECINCLGCADVCSTVMGKLGKKSLIEWSSPKSLLHHGKRTIFSKRNLMYFAAMIGSLIFAAALASEQEQVLVNINKPNELYKIHDGIVSNNYIVNIHNTQKQTYTYDVKVADKNFRIDRFESLTLKPDGMRKRILVISTPQNLSRSTRRDTPLRLKLTIFAQEDPKISITKEISFIYPRIP
ncbi:MAG: cytochrome c oxidase accessory protein CcoG [Sulfuricurvum sp. PD_MW2]|jgi:cytochrome c oxidase accessory protein FixG|uniref:cytochrome c oxidase accessory protein CcoG n=1 Tax=Sulfuricurvum sp. PD_MW2 TaxID=2027917 RepID=UPI000C06741D|nr:cytochrome c oxidase accessory protein CcoG [Sulfuricurvum sp. PD_MW2]PHM18181.1 MAG: cytochrome c oxidase accessory protein CcoG [Sulfuricurvum sp. PD_MW2]